MTVTIHAEPLEGLARDIFRAAGTPADIAAIVAESLVTTNLLGHDSHGVLRVKQYISMIRKGMIQPAQRPRIRKRFGATAMVTLGYGFGQIGARFAAELSIEMARAQGIAAVSLGQSTHIGRLGEWTHMIAEQGLIGIGFAGGGFSHSFVTRLMAGASAYSAPIRCHSPSLAETKGRCFSISRLRASRMARSCWRNPKARPSRRA